MLPEPGWALGTEYKQGRHDSDLPRTYFLVLERLDELSRATQLFWVGSLD